MRREPCIARRVERRLDRGQPGQDRSDEPSGARVRPSATAQLSKTRSGGEIRCERDDRGYGGEGIEAPIRQRTYRAYVSRRACASSAIARRSICTSRPSSREGGRRQGKPNPRG